MKTIGIIGSIGAGKSTIRERLYKEIRERYYGILVQHIDLDKELKIIFHNNLDFRERLVSEFGAIMVCDSPDRFNYVLDKIFTDDEAYYCLMGILEHYLNEHIHQLKVRYNNYDVLIIEGVQFIHSNVLMDHLDVVVNVMANTSLCINRVKERQKYTHDQILTLYKRTLPYIDCVINQTLYCVRTDVPDIIIDLNIDNIVTAEIKSIPTIVTKHKLESPGVSIHERRDILAGEGIIKTTNGNIITLTVDGDEGRSPVTAIYAGSFNPFHKGHLAVVEDLLRLYDKVIILKCINGGKVPSYNDVDLDLTKLPNGCTFKVWTKSFVDFLEECEESEMNVVIARGIRNGVDLDYENNYIHHVRDQYCRRGRGLPPVIYIPCREEYKHISSSSIRAIIPFDFEYARSLMI